MLSRETILHPHQSRTEIQVFNSSELTKLRRQRSTELILGCDNFQASKEATNRVRKKTFQMESELLLLVARHLINKDAITHMEKDLRICNTSRELSRPISDAIVPRRLLASGLSSCQGIKRTSECRCCSSKFGR
jgi:hypothetical protein